MVILRNYSDSADKSAVAGGGLVATGAATYGLSKAALKKLAKKGINDGETFKKMEKLWKQGKNVGKAEMAAGGALLGYSAYQHRKNKKEKK